MIKKIIIADDHPLFRSALGKCLSQSFQEVEIVHAKDLDSLQSVVQKHADSDLLLLDLYMPGCQGYSGLLHINGSHAELPVIVISANEKEEVMLKSVEYGAAGFLPKSSSPETIIEAINFVISGGIWLPSGVMKSSLDDDEEVSKVSSVIKSFTKQQFRVAMLLASGLQNKQIAYEMDVTEATIKAHLTSIFRKLGVSSRTLAVLSLKRLDIEFSE